MGVNQKGFSLLQVMIAAGLVAGMALALMRISTNQSQLNQRFSSENELHQMEALLMGYLQRKQTCDSALAGLSKGDNLVVFNVSGSFGDNFLEVGQQIAGTGWEVTEMRILTDAEAGAAEKYVDDNTFVLRIRLNQTREIIGGRDRLIYVSTVAETGNVSIVTAYTKPQLEFQCNGVLGETYNFDIGWMGICHDPPAPGVAMISNCGS